MERIVAAAWRLRRVYRIEAGVLSWQFCDVLGHRAEQAARACEREELDHLLMSTSRTVTDEARHKQAQARSVEAAADRDAEETALGVAFAQDAAGANALP